MRAEFTDSANGLLRGAQYETDLAVIAQGRKRITFGRTTYVCDHSVFLRLQSKCPS